MVKTEVEEAVERLWRDIPVGSGRDFNLVLKELERLRQMLDNE